ncbi:MAG: ABC transporter ATP-binding protein [Anaerolineae bacterium]|nr:ABC transporter ATP-binding protein [Anaerolineae bacterium]MDH7475402.1 ABC transporter ATP-binding protein [Anaerolineae bacterium]
MNTIPSQQEAGQAMIVAEGLTKRFNDFTAVDRVSFSVSAGEILALLGPNGAGKTTTVRMLASILAPTSGRVLVAGYDTVADAQLVRRQVGILTEFPGLYLRMKGLDYLDFFGQLYGLPAERRRQRSLELLELFGMADAAGRRIGEYSKGMRQKMALVRSLLHDPPVLLLDEPTSAMDPHSAKQVRDCIRQLRSAQRAIVLCTHNLPEAENLADRIAIIHQGRIIIMGSPAELKTRLLGPPLLELRWRADSDGHLPVLDDLIAVESRGPGWLRYRTAEPETVNPQLLHRLDEAAVEVVTLSEVPRRLEDVYLRVVEEA